MFTISEQAGAENPRPLRSEEITQRFHFQLLEGVPRELCCARGPGRGSKLVETDPRWTPEEQDSRGILLTS